MRPRSKIGIIVAREYLHRVRSKGFIVATILGPVAILALVAIPVATTVYMQDDSVRTIDVINEAGLDLTRLQMPETIRFTETDQPVDSLKARILDNTLHGYLIVPETLLDGRGNVQFVSRGGGGLEFRFALERAIGDLVRDARLVAAGLDTQLVHVVESPVQIASIRLSEEGEDADSTPFLSGLGYFMAMITYITVFLYGSLVMRSVIEEKTTRVVEVIVSSVRPFDLMIGKVLGVGAVGLTQLLVWGIALAGILLVGSVLIATNVDPATLADPGPMPAGVPELSDLTIPQLPVSLLVYYLLFFIGGYLLYASIFAAIGSMVEQESDAQQFMLPVAVPIILSLLLLAQVIEAPDSMLSVVASYIPFLSPILMPVRSAVTHLAFWEVPLSLAILFLSFLGTVWICARIYRFGILMYGKKPGLGEILRWARTP